MSNIRTFRVGLAAFAAVVALVAAGCSSTETPTSTAPIATSKDDAAALLGPMKQATGTPIKIGLVDDGKTTGIDHGPLVAAFNASVQYVNEHLGGINGHPLEVDECSTNNTPSDATACAIKMVNDKVATVMVPVSAQDLNVYNAMKDSGIPYVTYAAGAQEVIVGQNVSLFVNPLATLAAPVKLAKDNGVKKAAIVIVDVPAAVGPLKAIAQPIYEKAGIDLNIVPISPQTADLTPAIQQAISAGAEQFSVIGTDEFNASGIKALKQLGFDGKIVMVTAPSQYIVDNVPGGLEGVVYITSATSDPTDPDVKLLNAVLDTYLPPGTERYAQSSWSFALVLGLYRALNGNASAVDAPTFLAALNSMQKQPLPLGAGLQFQCGAHVVKLIANVCTDNALSTTLDAQGNGQGYQKLDVSSYIPGQS
jgi:branched-chain amino acid transport system substrate-binding protein